MSGREGRKRNEGNLGNNRKGASNALGDSIFINKVMYDARLICIQ